MGNVGRDVYSFQGYTLDLGRGCVRNGHREIELRAKSFELLAYLVANAGRLVSKDELVKAIWPNVVVSDDFACAMHQRGAAGPRRCRPAYHQDGAPARLRVCSTGYGSRIEEQTRKLFEVCRLRDVPIITFVNKLDREARDPFDLLDEIEQSLALDVTPASWRCRGSGIR